jgi:uncharacterized RDD family membrane protein YckC
VALLNVKTVFNIDLQFETSPFHLRLFAWVIDFVIMIVYWFLMIWFLNKLFDIEVANELGFIQLFLITPVLAYHIFFELVLDGQSPGKKLMGIYVVNLNGQQATVSQYLLRWLIRFIDFGILWGIIILAQGDTMLGLTLILGSIISFIMYVSSPYNQRLGDKVAGTTLVLKKLPYKLSDTIFQEIDVKNYYVHFPSVMRLSDKDINIVNNIVLQHNKHAIEQYIMQVAEKIKSVLHIETEMTDETFLETLLRDYNYLSRK